MKVKIGDILAYILIGVIILGIIVIVIGPIVLRFTGNSWRMTKKNLETRYSNGLDREVTVTNALNGDLIWSYSGKCYLSDSSNSGDITIMFYEGDGEYKKADFLGDMVVLTMIEK